MSDLAGTRWVLVSLGGQPPVEDSMLTLEFADSVTVGGDAGCNQFGGQYSVDGSTLTFSDLTQTLRACADDAMMAQETSYITALQNTASYRLGEEGLELLDADGNVLLSFEQGGADGSTENGEGDEGMGMPALDGTRWVLVSFGEDGTSPGADLTLEFPDSQNLAGHTGCNQFGGSYSVSDSMIRISELVQTEMACEGDGVMEQERRYLEALSASTGYEVSDDTLILLDADGNTLLRFEAAEGTESEEANGEMESGTATELAGTSWSLLSIDGNPAVSGSTVTLLFQDNGKAVGNAGCNQYGSDYTAGDGTLSLTAPVSTRMACADEAIMAQESAFLAALENVASYEMTGGELALLDANGEILLQFEQAGDDAPGSEDVTPPAGVTEEPVAPETTTPGATEESIPIDGSEGEDEAQRVNFAPGATSTLLEGSLAARESRTYILNIQEGQLLDVSAGPQAPLQLVISGEDGTVLRSGMGEGASFRGVVPSTQDYIIRVSAGAEPVEYSLTIIIPVRIAFEPGATSATVEGHLEASQSHHYVFGAQENQQFSVAAMPSGAVRLALYGVDGTVLSSGMGEGSSVEGTIPLTQDYIIHLSAGPEEADYTLDLEIR